jgi:xylulokinase
MTMYLGVDLGTSSIKLLLADENGIILDSESEGYLLLFPHDNWSEQNPTDWWEGFRSACLRLKKRHNLTKVKALSFSGQMHGLVALDKDGEVIRPAILWNDGRTRRECAYLNTLPVIKWTGNMALTGYVAPKLLWLKEHEPEKFARIAKILMPKDYLAYKLTGTYATDVSDASGTLYYDVQNRRWSKPMLDVLGITKAQLPKVYESVDTIGSVRRHIAEELGLSSDCSVVIGGGDQAMGAVGTGTVIDGQVSLSLGTSGVLFMATDSFSGDEKSSLHAFCHANGKYHLMGVTLAFAASMKWWVEDILGGNDYEKELEDISSLPVSEILFLPYMMGERSPVNDPGARGTFYGLTLAHNRRDITKALTEGVCMSLKDCLRVANERGMFPKSARVIGGGTKSGEWLQILSDVTGLELHTIQTSEGGALGAIMLAMVASGRFESLDDACKALIHEGKTYTPDAKKTKQYEVKFSKYRALYQELSV